MTTQQNNTKRIAHGEDEDQSMKKSRVEYTTQQIERFINTIRVLSADMVEKANSGHPGAPMGCAPIAHVLFSEVMNYAPHQPKWFNRDRFVQSNGHSCALLYSMLHLTGFAVSMDDLKAFRQLGSITPGHPENILTPGVEVSTGPLGQGISNAVGIALAEKHLAAYFNRDQFKVIDHYTYVICGDGCLQEGISSEASSLAGHLGLGKLIVCYDDNKITIDGSTDLSFTEDVAKRYEAYHWHVQTVADGNDIQAIRAAIEVAKAETERPSLIKIRTVIGYGSSKAGGHDVHGAPLGKVDLANTKQKFGFDPNQSFVVEEEAYKYYRQQLERGDALQTVWNNTFTAYQQAYPELAAELLRRIAGKLPEGLDKILPRYDAAKETKAIATRSRSEEIINSLAPFLPELIGGSADLTPSNLTSLKCSRDFQKNTPEGRYIRFGVREHAMAAICSGIYAHGGLRPYCATFLNFIGYCIGAVRVAALSQFPILYVMTHDSIGLGEDGPTHQPTEILQYLRATPNLLTFRPADGNETSGAYQVALQQTTTPSVISLSRQGAPTLHGSSVEKVAQGAYILSDFHAEGNGSSSSSSSVTVPTITLVSTGTEVFLAVNVAKELTAKHHVSWVRVVSMPCTELFDMQSLGYQESVFVPGSPVLSIEASSIAGWRGKYSHAAFGLPEDSYGMSAPAGDIFKYFGLTVDNLTNKAMEVVAWYQGKAVPNLFEYPRVVIKPNSLHHV